MVELKLVIEQGCILHSSRCSDRAL